jgi:peptidyl-prolyl cis-trans isomerase C
MILLSAAVQAGAAGPSRPIATAGGDIVVTGDDVLAEAAQRLPADVRAQALSDPRNVSTLATDVVMKRILARQAEQAGLDRQPRVALQLQLMRERVLAEAMLEAMDEKNRPDRAALERAALAEYRAQPEKFAVPEQIRASHILIDARSCDAEAKAAQLLQQARAPGADFAALAREHSHDPGSARRGGDLGFFERGRMAPEFEKAAFALAKPGDISDVVRTQFGFHIIRLEERRPATRQPFEAIREQMVNDLAAREARNRRRLATEAVAKEVKVDPEAIAEFTRQPR